MSDFHEQPHTGSNGQARPHTNTGPRERARVNWLDRPIPVTYFENEYASTKMERETSLGELAGYITDTTGPSKADLYWLKFARFGDQPSEKGCLRHNKNVLAISGVEAEHDAGEFGFDDAMDRLEEAGVVALGYTTSSHTEAAPRWRVVCPLSAEQPPDQRAKYVAWLNGVLDGKLSGESFTLSQSYFFGHVDGKPPPLVRLIDGRPLDLLPGLASGARGKSGHDGTTDKAGDGGYRHRPCDPTECLRQISSGEHYYAPTISLAGLRAQQAVSVGTCLKELADAYQAVENKDNERWRARWKKMPEHVLNIYALEAMASRTRQQTRDRDDGAKYTPPPGNDARQTPEDLGFWDGVFKTHELGDGLDQPYVIKGLVGPGQHAAMIGPPGSGKSVAAPDIGYSVAKGEPVFGHRTTQAPVVYVAAEDPGGQQHRCRGLLHKRGRADDFWLITRQLDLLHDAVDWDWLKALVGIIRPGLIIIDTVMKAFNGFDENASDMTGMGRVLFVVNELKRICRSAVMTLHHPPHSKERRGGGHRSYHADCDTVFFIEGERDGIRYLNTEKNRNGRSGDKWQIRIDSHYLGEDKDGDPVTTPMMVDITERYANTNPADRRRDEQQQQAWSSLDKDPKWMLEIIEDLARRGKGAENDWPGGWEEKVKPGTRLIRRRTVLRDALIQHGWFTEAEITPDVGGRFKPVKMGQDKERNTLRALKRFVGCDKDWVWLV